MAEPLIWLPLNGDFRNNGLLNVTITPQGSHTFEDGGKCGKCCKRANLYITNLGDLNYYPMTIAFWMKTTGTANSQKIMYFEKEGATHFGHIYANAASSTVKYQYTPTITITNAQPSEWHHYTFVITSEYAYGYLDGEFSREASSYSVSPTIFETIKIGEGYNIYLNDIRIYDTALSDYEIKLLSQGLILHYPLDNNGKGVVNNIDPLKVGNRNCSTFTYDGIDTWTCVAGPSSGTRGRGFSINDATIAIPSSSTWTVELEVKPEVACTWNCDINNSRDDGVTGSNDNDNTGLRTYTTDGVVTKSLVANKWQKIRFSQTAKSDVALHNAATNWGIVTDDNTTVNFQFRRIMGTLDTTSNIWTPYLGKADTTVYDTSGFGNNSTATNITYDGDTARYTASSVFQGGSADLLPSSITINNDIYTSSDKISEITLAFWIKGKDGTYPSLSVQEHYIYNDICQIYLDNDYEYNCRWKFIKNDDSEINKNYLSSTVISNLQWHHLCFTFLNGIAKFYYDGILKYTIDNSSDGKYIKSYNNGAIGASGNDGACNNALSDFRVYATALSDEDIKDLYEASAKVHRDGTMYAYSYVEN